MTVKGVEAHKVLVRADRKVDGIVYVTDNYEFKETWTAADGRSFTLSANALAKDVKAKSLGGSLYRVHLPTARVSRTYHRLVRRVISRDPRDPLVRLHDRPRGRELSTSWASVSPGRTRFDTDCARSSSRSPATTRRSI